MLYRRLPDLDPPSDADAGVDAPDLARTNAMAAVNEQYQPMLARIAEVGMGMIESIAARARSDAEAEKAGADAFCKVSQAVRRTIALQVKLARDATNDRNAVDAERARRRADIARAHKTAKDEAIVDGLHEAYQGSDTGPDFDPDGDIIVGIMDLDTERLDDDDEFAGYLERPVGETVAKLCAVVGLDPGACFLEDGAWRVRQAPLPPPCGEGGSERSDETGGACGSAHDPTVIGEPHISGADPPAPRPSSTVPHPDGFAVCPSP